jgi:AcrR family transcriptional regulator
MTKLKQARGAKTRTANMNRRRETILACAGEIIAAEGVDALTLGRLAEAAQVTVPTIHNLIGTKAQIFELLVDQLVQRVDGVLAVQEDHEPIRTVELFIDNLMELYADNESMYKAAFVAGEWARLFDQGLPSGIYARSLQLAESVCTRARQDGHLAGRVSLRVMSEQLFGCQRLARQDWVNGYIDLETYRNRLLQGMLLVLAADAVPEFHERLIQRLTQL